MSLRKDNPTITANPPSLGSILPGILGQFNGSDRVRKDGDRMRGPLDIVVDPSATGLNHPNSTGLTSTGSGLGAGVQGNGGPDGASGMLAYGSGDGYGIQAYGSNSFSGVLGIGGSMDGGAGVIGSGGALAGNGGLFTGTGGYDGIWARGTSGAGGFGTGAGIYAVGGDTSDGVIGEGGGIAGRGGSFTGTGGAAGVYATSATGIGGQFLGGTTGAGVSATGGATGDGVIGQGGATSGRGGWFSAVGAFAGVEGLGVTGATGTSAAIVSAQQAGVYGVGESTGAGVVGSGNSGANGTGGWFYGSGTGMGVQATSTSTAIYGTATGSTGTATALKGLAVSTDPAGTSIGVLGQCNSGNTIANQAGVKGTVSFYGDGVVGVGGSWGGSGGNFDSPTASGVLGTGPVGVEGKGTTYGGKFQSTASNYAQIQLVKSTSNTAPLTAVGGDLWVSLASQLWFYDGSAWQRVRLNSPQSKTLSLTSQEAILQVPNVNLPEAGSGFAAASLDVWGGLRRFLSSGAGGDQTVSLWYQIRLPKDFWDWETSALTLTYTGEQAAGEILVDVWNRDGTITVNPHGSAVTQKTANAAVARATIAFSKTELAPLTGVLQPAVLAGEWLVVRVTLKTTANGQALQLNGLDLAYQTKDQ